jgi:hypothetical protein
VNRMAILWYPIGNNRSKMNKTQEKRRIYFDLPLGAVYCGNGYVRVHY